MNIDLRNIPEKAENSIEKIKQAHLFVNTNKSAALEAITAYIVMKQKIYELEIKLKKAQTRTMELKAQKTELKNAFNKFMSD